MKGTAVAKRYSIALFEVAKEKKCLDQIEKDLKEVIQVWQSLPEFRNWVTDPTTEADKKKEIFSKAFPDVNQYTKNFLFLLADRKRVNELEAIVEEFHRLVNEEKGFVDAVVTTAFPLTEESRQKLIETFEPVIGKKLHIHEKVDSDILGGVIVQVGDRLFDGSLKTKLVRFQEQLSV